MFFCLEEELPGSQVPVGRVEPCLDLALRRAAGAAGCFSISAVNGKFWGECGCLPGAGDSKEDLPVTTKVWRSTGGRSALMGKVGWEKGAGQAGGVLHVPQPRGVQPGEQYSGHSRGIACDFPK